MMPEGLRRARFALLALSDAQANGEPIRHDGEIPG
jgi:hypothetical protein